MPNTLMICSMFLLAGFLPSQVAAQEPAKPEVQAEQPSQPSCRYCPNPDFPEEARKAKISSGRVFVEVSISERGDVDPDNISVTLEEPSGFGFAQKGVDVVKKWKFNPALKDGKPTKIRTRVHVQFTWQSHEKH